MTPEQLREWRRIATRHDGPGTIHVPRSALLMLLDHIPDAVAAVCVPLDEDHGYAVEFEAREGRLSPWTVGRQVVACEIRDAHGAVVAGSEVTTNGAEAIYPELVRAYRVMALRTAASAVPVSRTESPNPDPYVELVGDDIPYHLRDDAPPLAVCSVCHRQSWSPSELNNSCVMPQPDGVPCPGFMQAPS